MANVISVREGPLAIIGDSDGKAYVMVGENTLEAKRQADRAWTAAQATGALVEGLEDVTNLIGTAVQPGAPITVLSQSPEGQLVTAAERTKLADTLAIAMSRTRSSASFTTRVGFGTFFDEGVDLVSAQVPVSHQMNFRLAEGGTVVCYKLWERPQASTEALGPGDGSTDTLLLDMALPVAAFPGLVAGGAAVDITIEYDGYFEVREGYSYGYEVYALDAQAARVVVGLGLIAGTFTPDRRQTWIRAGANWMRSSGQSNAGTLFVGTTITQRDRGFRETRKGLAAATELGLSASADLESLRLKVGTTTRINRSYGYPLDGDLPSGNDRTYYADRRLRESEQLLSLSGRFTTAGNGAVVIATPHYVDGVMTGVTPIAIRPVTVAATGDQTVSVLPHPDYPGGVYPEGSVVGLYGPSGGDNLRLAYKQSQTPNTYRHATGAPSAGVEKAVESVNVHASLQYTVSAVDGRIPDRLDALDTAVADLKGGSGPAAAKVVRQRVNGVSGMTGDCTRMELAYPINGGMTFRLLGTCPADFDAIELICAHASPAPMTIAKATFTVVGSKAQIDGGGVNWLPLAYDGQPSGVAPAATGVRNHGFLISDRLVVSSVARTDGGALPLWMAQVYVTTPTTPLLLGRNEDGIDRKPWASHPEYPRISRVNAGDCVSTPASFTSTTNINTSPIVGIRFYRAGQVIAVEAFGDSNPNGEGGGITYQGASYVFEAVRELNDPNGVCYAHFNLAWSGSNTSTYLGRMTAAFEAGLVPDIAVLLPWSNNDIGTVITTAHVMAARQRLIQALDLCQQYNVKPAICTVMASNADAKNYGQTDQLRRDFNTLIRAMGQSRGAVVIDLAAVIDGHVNGNGQVEKIVGTSTDRAHLNDVGIQLAKNPVKKGLTLCGIAKVGVVAVEYP